MLAQCVSVMAVDASSVCICYVDASSVCICCVSASSVCICYVDASSVCVCYEIKVDNQIQDKVDMVLSWLPWQLVQWVTT